jgi:hypothetical protein
MDLVCEPDLYSPSVNADGQFIDKTPYIMKSGLRCPCASRKDKVYETATLFSQHIKTKAHQNWLQQLNLNKGNLYTECERHKETISQQQKIIAEQSIKISQLESDLKATTQCLAMHIKAVPVGNLLDIEM